jgi:hypothetical protein
MVQGSVAWPQLAPIASKTDVGERDASDVPSRMAPRRTIVRPSEAVSRGSSCFTFIKYRKYLFNSKDKFLVQNGLKLLFRKLKRIDLPSFVPL